MWLKEMILVNKAMVYLCAIQEDAASKDTRLSYVLLLLESVLSDLRKTDLSSDVELLTEVVVAREALSALER